MAAALSFKANLASTKLCISSRPIRPCPRPVPVAPVAGMIGPGKDWESYELNKNKNVIRKPMHIKTGDMVIVIAGNDKGTTGKVQRVNRKTGQVYLEGVNVSTRHIKPQGEGAGEIVRKEAPIHHSNVMHWSETQQVRSRIGHQIGSDGKKVRVLKKTGEVLPN